MKQVFFYMILLGSFCTWAQEVEVDLENFKEVEVLNGLTVQFMQGDVNRAVITGKESQQVNLFLDNGVLTINSASNIPLSDDNTVISITYRRVEKISARENSSVEFCSRLIQPLLEVYSSEGAMLYGDVQINELKAYGNTGGRIRLSGEAARQEIKMNATAEFLGENLLGNYVEVHLNGGGKANIFAVDMVKAEIKSGSNLYIYGKPKNVEEITSYGGTITKINE